jgi:hypothetical protein
MLYGPSKEPYTDEMSAKATRLRMTRSGAPRSTTKAPLEPRRPRTGKFVEATARRRSNNHARRHRPDLLQTTQMLDGA